MVNETLPAMNERGEYIDCVMRKEYRDRMMCTAVVGWYTSVKAQRRRCEGCTFYKTKTQVQREKIAALHRLSRLGLVDRVIEKYPDFAKWIVSGGENE